MTGTKAEIAMYFGYFCMGTNFLPVYYADQKSPIIFVPTKTAFEINLKTLVLAALDAIACYWTKVDNH